MKNRCGNCGKYPFCEYTEGADGYCDNWKAREITKLDKVTDGYYEFSKLKE